MNTQLKTETNVQQAVPFFMVADIDESLRYYVNGLGFEMTNKWIDEGRLQWCWLQCDGAALMLQEIRPDYRERFPKGKVGLGVSICFVCKDALALYRDFKSRGIEAATPFVGNAMWVTSLSDPDGYRIDFESLTDVPEGTVLSDVES